MGGAVLFDVSNVRYFFFEWGRCRSSIGYGNRYAKIMKLELSYCFLFFGWRHDARLAVQLLLNRVRQFQIGCFRVVLACSFDGKIIH